VITLPADRQLSRVSLIDERTSVENLSPAESHDGG
jgi:hypothetical protein